MPTFEELNSAQSIQPESLAPAKQLSFDDISKGQTVQGQQSPQFSNYSIAPENFSPNDLWAIDAMIDNDPDLDADEKSILKQNKFHFGDQLKDQIETLAGRKEEQKADAESIFTRAIATGVKDATATAAIVGTAGSIIPVVGNAIGAGGGAIIGGLEGIIRGAASEMAGRGLFQKDKRYYWGKDGLAHPYKIGDDLPEGASLEKVFSNRTDSEDDMGTTTLAKGFFNSFSKIGTIVPNIIDLAYGVATGDHIDYIQKINQVIDSEQFNQSSEASEDMVNTKAFTSLKEFANGDNWNVNLQNGMNFIGESTASLFQFLGAAGALKGVGAEAEATQAAIQALQAEGKLSPAMKLFMTSAIRNPKTWGISAAINLGEAMDAMKNAGVEGRPGFIMSTLVAAGMGALELSVGGMELNLLSRRAIADDVAKVMSKQLAEDGTEEITEKALKEVWKETMRSGAHNIVKRGKEMFKEAIGEGKEEVIQEMYTEAMQTLYDKYVGYANNKTPGDGAFGTEMFGPESLKEMFMNGLGGFIGGLVGGKMTKVEKSRDEIIFNAVANGKKEDLRSKLRTSKLTPDELNDAELKLDAFDHYHKETKDLVKHLDKDQKQEVFSLSFKSENAQRGITETEAKIEEAKSQGKATAILEGIKKAYETKMNEANNKIKEIVGNAETLKAEKEAEKAKKKNGKTDTTEEPEEEIDIETGKPIAPKKATLKNTSVKPATTEEPKKSTDSEGTEEELPKRNIGIKFGGKRVTTLETENESSDIEEENENIVEKENDSNPTTDTIPTDEDEDSGLPPEVSADDKNPKLTPPSSDTFTEPESKPEIKEPKKITSKPLTEAQQKAIDEEDERIEAQLVKKLPFAEQVNYHVANAVSNLKSFKPANVKRHNNLSGRESVSEESKQVRKNLKPGDVLDVTRVLPETGKKLYPNQSPVHTEGYNYSLEASKDGVHVGSIKYFDVDSETKQLSGSDTEAALKAFDEGREVKLVVVSNSSKGDIGYRVVVGPKKRGRKGKDHTVVLKEIEDRQLEKLDKVRSKLNKFLDDMEGGKGSAKMSVLPIAPGLRLAINTGLSVFEKAIKLKKVTRKLWMEAVDAVKDEYGRKKWYNLKQEQRKKIIEMLRNYNTQLSEDMKLITRVEATQEDIEDFAYDYDLTMEETKEAMARYGERKQYDENTRRIKSWLYNELGECVIPDMIVPQLIHELRNFANSGVVDLKNVAESYENLPTKKLADYLAETISEEDFVWMHQHLTSNVPLPVFHVINNGREGFSIEKSNLNKNKFRYLNELKKIFEAHETAYSLEKNYKTIVNKYRSDIAGYNNDFKVEIARKLKLNPAEIDLINRYNSVFDTKFDLQAVSLGRLMYNIRNEEAMLDISEPDSSKKAKVISELKTLLERKTAESKLRDYASRNIEASVKVAEDLTGIPKEQWRVYLKNQNKTDLSDVDFFIDKFFSALKQKAHYNAKTNIEMFIIKDTYPEFRKNLTEKVEANAKTGAKAVRPQLETLAQELAKTTINDGESEYYDNVAGNRKPSAEMISSFEMRARLINSPLIQNHSRLKNNPIVKEHKDKQLLTARYDGVNNRRSKSVAEAKKITGNDLLFSMIIAFNDRTGKYIGKDEYFHFYNQQGDSSEKLMVALKRRPLSEISKFVEKISSKKDLENDLTDTEIFLNDMVSSQNIKGIDVEELSKEFVYNYIYNKYHLDEIFRGNDGKFKPKKQNGVYSNAKDTRDLSKRKDYVTGFQMNTEIEGGVGKTHNVCILNDAMGLSAVTGKNFEMFDGQQIILPWYNERVKVSTGGQYGDIIKDIYFKNELEEDTENGFNPDGTNTMLKGNCIVLDPALAEKYPALQELYDYALKHDIDRFSFTSTSKLVDPRYVNTVSWEGRNMKALPEKPVIYKADNTHVLIQQDLTNDAVLKKDSMLTQPLHIIKGMRSMSGNQKNIEQVETLLAKAVEIVTRDFHDEIDNLTNEELKSFYLDAVPNENKYLGYRQFLSDPKTDINSPAYDSFRNSMFSAIVESRLLGIPANKTIGVHIQLPGIDLKPMRVENGEIKPGEMIASYNSMKSKKNPRGLDLNENVLIVRVPADDWSSMTVSTVIDNFPPGMKNAVMTDAEYQQGGGMDNDGDGAHIIAKFKDKEGNFIQYDPENTTDFKGIMNEVLDLIMAEYLRPDIKNNPTKLKEHLEHMQKPIDTDAVDNDIKRYVDKDNNMDKNMPSSVVKMWDANRHSSIVTGLSANAIKVKNYLYGLGATLKKAIAFPKYDENGNVVDVFSDLQKFKHSDKDQDRINNNMRNNLNQSLDNAKLGKLFYMGKLAATSAIFDYISMLHPDIQSSLIHFMNNSVVQEYIKVYDQSASPLYTDVDRSNVFEVLAKKLGLESGKMNFAENDVFPSAKALNATKDNWENATTEQRQNVFKFLQSLEYKSRDIGMINKIITLNEKGLKTYGQYRTASKSFKKVIGNKLNSINLLSGGFSIEELNSLKRAKEQMMIMKNHYDLDNVSIAEAKLSSFDRMLGALKGRFDKNNNPKEGGLTDDQINTFYRTWKDAISIHAANVTESVEELRNAAKKIFDSFPAESIVKEYFEIADGDILQLIPSKRRMELEADFIKSVQRELEKLTDDEKKTLLKYQIKQFGENTSNNSGGFYQFLPLSILSEHSENIQNLDLYDVLQSDIIENMLIQNIDMIPMVTIGNIGLGATKLGVLSENNTNITKFSTPVIKARDYRDGQLKYYKVEQLESGEPFININNPIDVYRKDSDKTVNFLTAKKATDDQKMSKINSMNSDEELASVDPELQEQIREHLSKMFPQLLEFSDPVLFQEFLDRNYPGQVLDPDALGTEIGNVFFVDPDKALQSTMLHEVAHKYFDMIPDSDPNKSALIRMFSTKYNAIRAIQESHKLDMPGAIEEGIVTDIGRKAFEMAKIQFGNNAYFKFMDLLKNFWVSLKKAVFPKNLSYEDHLRIMSNRYLKNKDEISVFRTSERMRNMKAIPLGEYGKHEDLIKDIQREAGLDGQKDLKNLSAYTVWKMRTKNPEVYHGEQPYLYEIFKTEFPEAFIEDVVKSNWTYQFTYESAVTELAKYGITPETHPEKFEELKKSMGTEATLKAENKGIQFVGPKMDFNEFILRKTKMTSIQLRGKFSKKAYEQTEGDLKHEYALYEEEYRQIHQLANEIHKVEDVLEWDKETFNDRISTLRSMDQMISINDSFHSSCLRALAGHYMDMIAVDKMKMESEDSYSGNRLWIKAYHSIMFEGNTADWSAFLANFFGEGVTAPYKSPRDIREKPLQLFQQLREEVYNNYKATSNTISHKMDELHKQMQKEKINLKKHAVYVDQKINKKTGAVIYEKEMFHEPKSAEFLKMPKIVQEYMNLYFSLLNDDGIARMANSEDFYNVPQTNADLPELIKKQMKDGSKMGYIRAVGLRLRKDERYDEIAIKYDQNLPAKKLGDIKKELLLKAKGSKVKELAASYKIGGYYRQAKAIVDSGAIFDDGGNYLMRSQFKKIPDPLPFKRDISSTDNVHASMVKYLDQKIMSNKYSAIAPMFEFFEDLYSDNQNPVIHNYIKTLNNKMLYNRDPKDPMERIRKYIEFFNALAIWQMLGFNIKAAGFNVGTGLTQNFRDQGFMRTWTGVHRTWHGFKFTGKIDDGFMQTKTFHLLHKFKIVNISRDMEISPGSVMYETFKKVIFSPMATTEYMNLGMTVSGMIPQEIWDNYDNEMNLIPNADPRYILTDDMVRRIIAEASRTHGAYQDMIKRPYTLTLLGRTVNLLRNWLPDIYHAHFSSEYVDAHDVTRKGIIRSGYHVIKALGSDPKNFVETARNLSDIDKQNLGKALREMMMTAILMMAYSGFRDDDKEKANIFMKLASDVGFVYDFNNYEALLSAGFPAFRSLLGTIDASKEILKVVTLNPTTFENSSKYAEKGDWKAPIVIMRQIPIVNKYIPKREK